MTMHRFARILTTLPLLLTLAACGSNTSETSPAALARQAFDQAFNGADAPPSQIPASQIETAYGATEAPIALVTVESRSGQAIVLEIEQNGPYQTFSTSARQVFVLRDGMITATRGIGGDLMSSEADGLLALVRARQSGKTPYVMRFLDGEDVTETMSYVCDVFPDGSEPVAQGRLRASATKMVANCTGETKPFTSTFLVDASGYILSGRQWLGDYSGYVRAQTLRK